MSARTGEQGDLIETHVWDSRYLPVRDKLTAFQDMRNRNLVPGTFEVVDAATFDVRVERVAVDSAMAVRIQSTPFVSTRTFADGEKSSDYFCASFVLSGGFLVDQWDRTVEARPGDLAIFDCGRPSKMVLSSQDNLSLIIPKQRFPATSASERAFQNTLIAHEKLLAPLAQCYTSLAGELLRHSKPELTSLLNACISLLPVAAGCFDAGSRHSNAVRGQKVFRIIVEFIEDNLTSSGLSAMVVAAELGISDRYVHRLFAVRGTTFSAYVSEMRLKRIRAELESSSHSVEPISSLAYRWGFNDISTFNKAFKQRFGLSPRNYRNQFA